MDIVSSTVLLSAAQDLILISKLLIMVDSSPLGT